MPTLCRTRFLLLLALVLTTAASAALPSAPARPPLTKLEIDAITQLVMLEDTRRFDETTLARILRSIHPEVRRRAVQAVGRIVNEHGRALLESMRADPDTEVVATVAFASGQLKDPASVSWLTSLLSSPKTPASVAKEAACALGKIRSPQARAALEQYLDSAPTTPAAAPIVGEALLSIGRFPAPAYLEPIVRWTTSPDGEVRWRAAWALFRPRDPKAFAPLLALSEDTSADVRFWAVRGLAPPPNGRVASIIGAVPAPLPALVDDPNFDRARASARLRDALKDPDRRVRTEALRALVLYDDDASFAAALAALDSADTWMSVSAAEQMGRFTTRKDVVVPKLVAAADAKRPTALRITALAPLQTLAPEAAVAVAEALARDPKSVTARNAGRQALGRLGAPGRAALDAITADPAMKDLLPTAAGGAAQRPAVPPRTEADYRRIVEKWIVPDYNGAPKPHAIWDTPKGQIEIELYPGDAPLGLEEFVRVVESGSIVGTEFSRVVPNFVDQQATIRDARLLRDEVNRHGLTRGNLAWASSGLDTGRPGYTLGNTPQPHNEGDFTALGRVVRGMDVVDRIELGDRITGARMIR
jgi:peptidylprolyl isomerase